MYKHPDAEVVHLPYQSNEYQSNEFHASNNSPIHDDPGYAGQPDQSL